MRTQNAGNPNRFFLALTLTVLATLAFSVIHSYLSRL